MTPEEAQELIELAESIKQTKNVADKQNKCEVCSQYVYEVNEPLASLELWFKDGWSTEKNNTIYAYGDGVASMKMKYCPNCGRKLD